MAKSGQTVTRSVAEWGACGGGADQTAALTRAITAARNDAFTLVIDCNVRIHIGMDIDRPIFIDSNTTVEFTSAGRLIVDNTFVPAFVIANSNNIELRGWNIEYDASLPVWLKVGGHEEGGAFVHGSDPGNAFNDLRLTKWLAVHRGISFDGRHGWSTAKWVGSTNICAIFYIAGDSSSIVISGMNVEVPPTAGASRFAPVVFSFSPDYKSGQRVDAHTPYTGQFYAIPHDVTFSDIALDGTYMGWVGTVRNASFANIVSYRYADLEDANGSYVGGVDKWFAPPHLFYLSYVRTLDAALYNRNIKIEGVKDAGIRMGTARDRGGNDSGSGNALSLKLGCVNCSVDNYQSDRPDGFLDILSSENLTLSNIRATYDSAFLNNRYPGWRFPEAPYINVTFENITLKDVAPQTFVIPIDNTYDRRNKQIRIKNVKVQMERWSGDWALPFPTILGDDNSVLLDYSIRHHAVQMTRSLAGTVETTLQAVPAVLRVGQSTALHWGSKDTNSCAPVGAWSGNLRLGGSRTIRPASPGTYSYTLQCRNNSASSTSTLHVVVAP